MTAEPNDYEIWNNISTHILTRRMTISSFKVLSSFIFQLTSSQGGWRILAAPWMAVNYFNSHPHKEDDLQESATFLQNVISTHILTRRMTTAGSNMDEAGNISTHILTRRMTFCKFKWLPVTNISTHILTRRMTFFHIHHKAQLVISTHILTRRMTC